MSKTIRFNLSSSSIENAIKEIKQYQTELNRKCELFCQRLTDLGKITAEAHIAESSLGKYVGVTTTFTPEQMGCKAVLLATGGSIASTYGGEIMPLMCLEFGAGIHYNSIPNPKASEFGMGVGTYPGQTHAYEDGWYYLGNDDQWHYTHGIKATMPMYNASTEMILNIQKIAKEVFKS